MQQDLAQGLGPQRESVAFEVVTWGMDRHGADWRAFRWACLGPVRQRLASAAALLLVFTALLSLGRGGDARRAGSSGAGPALASPFRISCMRSLGSWDVVRGAVRDDPPSVRGVGGAAIASIRHGSQRLSSGRSLRRLFVWLGASGAIGLMAAFVARHPICAGLGRRGAVSALGWSGRRKRSLGWPRARC